jgi:hypothetical protein
MGFLINYETTSCSVKDDQHPDTRFSDQHLVTAELQKSCTNSLINTNYPKFLFMSAVKAHANIRSVVVYFYLWNKPLARKI